MKKLFLFLAVMLASLTITHAQNVNIPDTTFKAYLVGDTSINTNGDTEIQVSEAQVFTGTIDCRNMSISDLTGIEAFTALTELDCQNNSLSSIDLSNNTNLTFINVGNNNLGSLDVSNNTALTILYCYGNQINNLNISAATALTELDCRDNWLSSLDISNNTNLTELLSRNNFLSSLNVSSNTALTYLDCMDNQISSLDVSSNTNLITLACHTNNLSSLDVTNNSVLTQLVCHNNQLTNLNVANGNNTNFTSFNAINNPNLSCIQVDDSTYSNNNWTNIDSQHYFSENCGVLSVDKTARPTLEVYPNPTQNQMTINSDLHIQEVQVIDTQGRLVKTIRNQSTIPVTDLQQGLYFLTIVTDKETYQSTFVKE